MRSAQQIRHQIELARDQLASAVEELREGIGEATDLTGRLRARLPAVVAGGLRAGFVLAGRTKAKVGRFSLVDRD